MIRKESPGINFHGLLTGKVSQPGNKIFAIFIAEEYFPLFDPPSHDMVQNSRGV